MSSLLATSLHSTKKLLNLCSFHIEQHALEIPHPRVHNQGLKQVAAKRHLEKSVCGKYKNVSICGKST